MPSCGCLLLDFLLQLLELLLELLDGPRDYLLRGEGPARLHLEDINPFALALCEDGRRGGLPLRVLLSSPEPCVRLELHGLADGELDYRDVGADGGDVPVLRDEVP